MFPEVALAAERLRVGLGPFSTVEDGDDVVEFQLCSCSAVKAGFSDPVTSLSWREYFSISSLFRRYVEPVLLSSRKRFQHLLAMRLPQFFGRKRNPMFGVLTVAVAMSLARVGDREF